MVGMEGVEPPRLAALGSKPSVSTSSTTSPIFEHYKGLYFYGKNNLKIIITDYSQSDFF